MMAYATHLYMPHSDIYVYMQDNYVYMQYDYVHTKDYVYMYT